MLRYPTLVAFTCCIYSCCWSQNFVPNPGFETYKPPSAQIDDISKCIPWNGINTADHFNSGTASRNRYRIESFSVDSYKPRTDKCYAGFRLQPQYSEYIKVKLLHKLRKGHKYAFRMYIHLSEESSHCVNTLGVHFSHSELGIKSIVGQEAHINVVKENGIRTSGDWEVFGGVYQAAGGEHWMTIGNFEKPVAKKLIPQKPGNYVTENVDKWAEVYYYVDDVALTEIPPTEKTKEEMPVRYGKTTVLENIFFETGREVLLPRSYQELDKLVEALKHRKSSKIQIQGHTDNVGNEADNIVLSERRAKTVKDYLVEMGINASRIGVVGLGSSKPVADNNTTDGRQRNRRVEFILEQTN